MAVNPFVRTDFFSSAGFNPVLVAATGFRDQLGDTLQCPADAEMIRHIRRSHLQHDLRVDNLLVLLLLVGRPDEPIPGCGFVAQLQVEGCDPMFRLPREPKLIGLLRETLHQPENLPPDGVLVHVQFGPMGPFTMQAASAISQIAWHIFHFVYWYVLEGSTQALSQAFVHPQ